MLYSYPNRTICAVLDDMRKSYSTYNFSNIASLIEECQMLANRMEARLENAGDYEYQREQIKKLKKEIKQLEDKKQKMEES